MKVDVGDTAIITTDNWFVAPDGCQYRSVFGTIHGVDDAESVLGVKTNSRSTNWYVRVGNMILAGCQIHYLVKCGRDDVHFGKAMDSIIDNGKEIEQMVRPKIYDADT